MIQALLNETVIVKRRVSTGRDSLNNPTYGTPTSGSGWSTVYSNMPIRFAFDRKQVQFSQTGERIQPSGTIYYQPSYSVLQEDRFLTTDGIEYVVVSVQPAYITGSVIDHWEAICQLP